MVWVRNARGFGRRRPSGCETPSPAFRAVRSRTSATLHHACDYGRGRPFGMRTSRAVRAAGADYTKGIEHRSPA